MDRASKLVFAFIFLFALPFAAFGVYALAQTVNHLLTGEGNGPVWLGLLFGIVFSGIGFGLIFLVVFGSRIQRRDLRLRAEHPSEPWLWRKDWAAGRIQSQTRAGMIGAWVFALFWNLISAPIGFAVIPGQVAKNPAVLLGLIFPLVGIFLLIHAIRQTIAYSEFGRTYFEIPSVPGVVGCELKGTIQARFPHSPDHGVHLRFSCVNRVTTGSGNSSSTSERIVWRDEADLNPTQIYPGPAGTSIPVDFRIPRDAQPTAERSPGDRIVWLLEAMADVPGVNYHDIFEVPVFRTQQTPAQPEAEPARYAAQPVTQPPVMTVQVQASGAGTEFFFPAGRNKGFAATSSFFLALFGGVTVAVLYFNVPKIFGVFFGFFALLLLYITLQLWFGTTRVGIGSGVLRLQSGWLGGGKVREFTLGDIQGITDRINSQQGGATGVPYYDIEMQLRSGNKFTLGRTLSNKREAEWLVEEMRRLAGVDTKSMSAGSAV
jgi:hypothetical protein